MSFLQLCKDLPFQWLTPHRLPLSVDHRANNDLILVFRFRLAELTWQLSSHAPAIQLAKSLLLFPVVVLKIKRFVSKTKYFLREVHTDYRDQLDFSFTILKLKYFLKLSMRFFRFMVTLVEILNNLPCVAI